MLRRLFLLSLFVFLVGNVSFGNSIYTKEQIDRFSRVQYKIVNHGEHFTAVNNGLVPDYKVANTYGQESDWYNTVSEVLVGTLRNYYDLEGNGTPLQIWQDPNTPNNIHAVYTFSAEESGWNDRTTQYFFSTDKGATWSFIGNVPASGRAGFGTITGLSTGAALIACHTAIGSNTAVRTVVFADAFPGLGSFNSLDPNDQTGSRTLWPRIVATSNALTNPNKFVFAVSTNGADSSFWNTGTSLTSGSFLGYKPFNASPAENYSLARGTDGRIGLAYLNDGTNDPANYGDIYFMESTNSGTSFGAPQKIFDADFSTDSLGGLRGISIVYKNNTACVAFETIKQTTAGNFFPGAPSKIRFWASGSSSSVVIADSNNVPYAPYTGTNDVLAPLCRPSIGVSSDGNTLFVSMMVASSATGSTDTTSMGDIYLTTSGNGGSSWKKPRIVNSTSPRMDWRYASISPTNDVTGAAGYVNMLVQRDVVPGSNVNLPNSATDAHPVFWRVAYTAPIGINTISSVADNYSLQQNFPNPFNPSTTIRFSLPQASNVMLKVYNLSGQEVATLVNNQLVASGVQEVSFNASNLASGLYFYTITAGNFQETKKMMLIK